MQSAVDFTPISSAIPDKEIERLQKQGKLKSPQTSEKVQEPQKDQTDTPLRSRDTPLKQQANMEVKLASLREKSNQINDKLEEARKLVTEFRRAVQNKIPEKAKEARQEFIQTLQKLQTSTPPVSKLIVESTQKQNQASDYNSGLDQPQSAISRQQDPQALIEQMLNEPVSNNTRSSSESNGNSRASSEVNAARYSSSPASQGANSIGHVKFSLDDPTEALGVTVQSQIGYQPATNVGYGQQVLTAPSTDINQVSEQSVSLGDLVANLKNDIQANARENARAREARQAYITQRSNFNLEQEKKQIQEEQDAEAIEFKSDNPVQQVALQNEQVTQIEREAQDTISTLVHEFSKTPASVLRDGPSKHLDNLLNEAIKLIDSRKNTLTSIRNYETPSVQANRAESITLSQDNVEPIHSFQEAEIVAQDIAADQSSGQGLQLAQLKFSPNAVSQLLF